MDTMFDFYDVHADKIENITIPRCKKEWECELHRSNAPYDEINA